LYAPEGWSLLWDDSTDSYLFVNCVTNEKSWGWPLEEIQPVPPPPKPVAPPILPTEACEPKVEDEDMELASDADETEESPCQPHDSWPPKSKKKKVTLRKPESVSISAKSKKMAHYPQILLSPPFQTTHHLHLPSVFLTHFLCWVNDQADMLVKWRTARQDVEEGMEGGGEGEEEEEEEYNVEEWVQEQQQKKTRNPNFTPLGQKRGSAAAAGGGGGGVGGGMKRPRDSDEEGDESDGEG
ncbi:hypothetical protein HDU67_009863, partial [Dinochytrium kinnereticum]